MSAAATEIQKQQIEANFKMQAIDRREIERYQEKEKEMLERELHTRMELEKQLAVEKQEILKLKYEAKTRSLEQKLKERSQLLSTIQKGVSSEVFGSRFATEREMFEQGSMVGGSTVQTMAATPSLILWRTQIVHTMC